VKKLSQIDDFMSEVIDLTEKEKEEVILFLASAVASLDAEIVKNVSRKVQIIVMPFLVEVLMKKLKKDIKGGEKVGSNGLGKLSKKD